MADEIVYDKSKYSDGKPNFFLSMLNMRCPRCRRGPMFRNNITIKSSKNMEMHKKCPLCGQYMELEVGFYYGTGYVSYALCIVITVAVFVAYYVLIGISINDYSLYYYLAIDIVILILIMPYIMRLSRTVWLYFFAGYDKDWKTKDAPKPERIVEGQMGNW